MKWPLTTSLLQRGADTPITSEKPQYVPCRISQRSSLWDQLHKSILGSSVLAGPSALSSSLDTHPHQVT